MFGLFKKKSEKKKLQLKYEALMTQWHRLSSTNRAKSDEVYAEAQEIMKSLESMP